MKFRKMFWLHCACLDSFCELTQIQSREDLYVVYTTYTESSVEILGKCKIVQP